MMAPSANGGVRIRHAFRVAVGVALIGVMAGCSAASSGSGDSGSCAAVVEFRGASYIGYLTSAPPARRVAEIPRSHMHVLGSGEIPSCSEANGSTIGAQSVEVARISGVNPSIAVAVLPHRFVYIRRGAVLPPILKRPAGWILWVTA